MGGGGRGRWEGGRGDGRRGDGRRGRWEVGKIKPRDEISVTYVGLL